MSREGGSGVVVQPKEKVVGGRSGEGMTIILISISSLMSSHHSLLDRGAHKADTTLVTLIDVAPHKAR